MLRDGGQRYRTCLDCLGQGLLANLIGGRGVRSGLIS